MVVSALHYTTEWPAGIKLCVGGYISHWIPACNGSVDGMIINQIHTKSVPRPRPSGNVEKKSEATEATEALGLVQLPNARVENRRDALEQDAFLKLLSPPGMKDRARKTI